MKTRIILTILLVLGMVGGPVASSYAADVTTSVSAAATIGGIHTLTSVVREVSNDAVMGDNTLRFGIVSSAAAHALHYLEVGYVSNETLWKVCIYTDNTDADATAFPYQKAGLLNEAKTDRIPLYWCAYDGTTTPANLTLDANGVPEVRTTSAAFGSVSITDWAVMKDRNDLDIPESTTDNESWATAFAEGYCDIMYGSPAYSNLNPFPYFDAPNAGTEGTYNSDPALSTLHRPATSPVVVYIGGGTGFASAGVYTSTIYFDLYHE